MALKFLSGHSTPSGSSSSVKHFDIRLNEDYVVLRGGEDEAASAQLAGNLVLCLTDALNVHHVQLTLSGIVHMSYMTLSNTAISGRKTGYKEKTFYEKSWTFFGGKGKAETLSSNNYEWPFEAVLDGNVPESVEGLKDAYVIYRLKAEISRKRGKDIVVRKPLRIVRTLGSAALELSHAMSVENVWPNKIEYSISTPSKAVIFGSFIQVDFKLVPLLKGLVIGNVATQLKEEQEFVLDPEWNISALNGGVHKQDRIIAYDTYKVEAEDEQILDETAEGFQFSRYLELPKTLSKCVQDCNVKGIKVRHKIKFNVQLHNPDGHTSELRANLPVSLYISTSLPLNANNDLVDQSPQAGRAAVANDLIHTAPPVYGQHQLDQLYSAVDQSGYRTPGFALSSSATPYSASRNLSSENVASLDTVANGDGHVSAAALQQRLQNLRVSERSFSHHYPQQQQHHHDDGSQPRSGCLSRRSSHQTNDYFSRRGSAENGPLVRGAPTAGVQSRSPSQPHSREISRQNSQEDSAPASGSRTPYAVGANHFEDLVKVPSYTTAVRTPAPRTDSGMEGLPTYGAVVQSLTGPAPTEPPGAHVRGTSHHYDSRLLSRNVGIMQDEARQLDRIRIRGQ